MKTVCVIMAGGKGERFWPKSRNAMPKQFLSIDNTKETLLQKTVTRVAPFVAIEDVFVLTNENYKNIVKKQLPNIPLENIVCEPVGRNTAPAIGLGLEVLRHKYDDCVMVVLPSDHVIQDENEYRRILSKAIDFASNNNSLVTLGVNPTNPNTGYGYIKMSDEVEKEINKVDSFKEKPNLETAKQYLNEGNYVWNAGMFVWKLSSIDEAFEKHMPQQYEALKQSYGQSNFVEAFSNLEKVSIDIGVMEKANNIYVIKGEFGWDDVGSWEAVHKISKKDANNNAILSDKVKIYNTKNTLISTSENKLIATVGLDNIVIVETGDAILIANKDLVGDIREIVKQLKEDNMEEYL